MADSAVIIDTKLDNAGIIKGVRDSAKEIAKISNAFDSVNVSIIKQEAIVENLRKKYEEAALQADKIDFEAGIDSEEFKEAAENMDKLNKELTKAEDNLSKFKSQSDALKESLSGVEVPPQLESDTGDLNQTFTQLGYGIRRISSGASIAGVSLSKFVGAGQTAMKGVSMAMKGASASAVGLNLAIAGLGLAIAGITMAINAYQEHLEKQREREKAVRENLLKIAKAAGIAAYKIGEVVVKTQLLVGKTILTGLKKFADGVFTINKYLQQAQKAVVNFAKKAVSLFKNIFIFNALSKAAANLSDVITGLTKENTKFSKSLNAIQVNALTAFAPFWQMIEPALVSFMDILARVTQTAAVFIAMLFGQTYQQAKDSAQAMYNQAKSINAVGKASKEAGKQLASFDQINKLAEKTSSDVADSLPDLNWDILAPDLSWIDKFKEMLDSFTVEFDKFYAIGATISESINDSLKNINWTEIQKTAKNIAAKIASLINGFLANKSLWATIVKTVGNGLNTITRTVNTFFENVNFEQAGQDFAIALRNAIETIDFDGLALFFTNGFNALIDILYGFLNEFTDDNWIDLGTKLANGLDTAINSIDFYKISTVVSKGINGAFATLSSFAETFPWSDNGTKIGSFINKMCADIKWKSIGKTIGSLFNGSLNFIKSAIEQVDWIQRAKDLTDAVRAFIKETDWKLVGSTLATLFNSVLSFIHTLILTFPWKESATSLTTMLNQFIHEAHWGEIGETIRDLFHGALDFIIEFLDTFEFDDLALGLSEMFNRVIEDRALWLKIGVMLATAFNKAVKFLGMFLLNTKWTELGTNIALAIATAIEGISWEDVEQLMQGIINLIHGIATFFEELPADEISDAMVRIFERLDEDDMQDALKRLFDSITTVAVPFFAKFLKRDLDKNTPDSLKWFYDWSFGLVNSIISGFTGNEANLENTIFAILKYIKDPLGTLGEWIPNLCKGIQTSVINIINKISKSISNIIDDTVNIIKAGINNIIDFLNGLVSRVETAVNAVKSAIGSIAGFVGIDMGADISLPRIPRLARGGIVDSATIAMIGEKGREAVVPLSQNAEWMEPFRQMQEEQAQTNNILQQLVELMRAGQVIEMDGVVTARTLRSYTENENRRVGGSMMSDRLVRT